MASSSGLYGEATLPTVVLAQPSAGSQDVNSTNSTSLYGEASTPIPDSSGNVVVRGDLIVLSGNILTTAATGNIFPTTATTVNLGTAATAVNIGGGSGNTTVNNNLVVSGSATVAGDISATGADFGLITIAVADDQTITTTGGELRVSSASGNVKLAGVTALYTDNTGTFNLLNQPTTVAAFRNATVLEIGEDSGTTGINNNLRVDGTLIAIAPATTFSYSEANNRLNRPNFQSSTGNTSGMRAIAPNTTSSARGIISAFSSSDLNNGEFVNITALNGGSNPLRIQTGSYTAGVLGSSTGITFVDNSTTYATVNPAGVTVGSDLTTKTYVDALVIAAGGVTSITGTADQVIASSSTGAITLSLPQSIATTSNVTFADITATDDLSVQGNNVNLAQATLIGYSENNLRTNRLQVQSTTGNTSGLRVLAPNVTTSAASNFTVFGSSDNLNGEFLGMQATGSTSAPFSIRTGKYIAGVLNSSGQEINFVDNITTYASINPAGATVGTDLTTKTYVDLLIAAVPSYDTNVSPAVGGVSLDLRAIVVPGISIVGSTQFIGGTNVIVSETSANVVTISAADTNTTYDFAASSTSGGANLNLIGSDATTDTVKLSNGGGITATRTSSTEVTLGSTATNLNTVSTIVARDASGNFSAGTITAALTGTATTATTATQVANSLSAGTHLSGGPFNGSSAVTLTTDATNLNTSGTIVARNGSGDFSAGTITAALSGNATTATTAAQVANSLTAGTFLTGGPFNGSSAVTLGTNATAVNTASTIVARDAGGNFSAGGAVLGNLSVGIATDNTIVSTDTNGNIVLDPNGTGQIVLGSIIRAQGEVQASTNINYVFPLATLSTLTDNNGYSAASSFEPNTLGYSAAAQYIHFYGDTLAAQNAAASLNFRAAEGNSVTGVNLPWLGTPSVAPSAILSGTVCGTTNFNGYATSGFTNDIATQYQGGGLGSSHIAQTQVYAAENLVDGTLSIAAANITAVSSFRVALTSPAVTGTRGQISFGTTTPAVGQAIRVTGTLTGTATGIVSGQDYYILFTNGSTTATLAATPNGNPIVTTGGTLTGLTLTRCGVTLTLTGQTVFPFGRNALVTVSGITNVTAGVYPVGGGVTTVTSILLGIPHTTAPTLPGTQTLSCASVTNGGGGYRIRAYPTATVMNPQNRLNIVDHTAASCTLRANTFAFNTGAFANTGVGVTGNNLVYNRVHGQFEHNTTVTASAANTAAVFPLGTPVLSNVATVGSTSRLIPGAAGVYNLQFSVQVDNSDVAQDHEVYIWLRKNGADVAGSTGRETVSKTTTGSLKIIGWNYLVSSANTTDYFELGFAVENTNVTFPAFAALAFGPSTATLITTLTPVGA